MTKTCRILLSFYSKTIGEVLDGNRDDLAGVSVPASSSSLTMMLKVCIVHVDRSFHNFNAGPRLWFSDCHQQG